MNAESISYITNNEGQPISVIIPFGLFEKMDLEDLYDSIVAKHRLKNDEFVEFK